MLLPDAVSAAAVLLLQRGRELVMTGDAKGRQFGARRERLEQQRRLPAGVLGGLPSSCNSLLSLKTQFCAGSTIYRGRNRFAEGDPLFREVDSHEQGLTGREFETHQVANRVKPGKRSKQSFV